MPMKIGLTILLLSAGSAHGLDLRYWIEPCTRPETACQKADVELAEWALQAWQAAADGKLKIETTPVALADIGKLWEADMPDGRRLVVQI